MTYCPICGDRIAELEAEVARLNSKLAQPKYEVLRQLADAVERNEHLKTDLERLRTKVRELEIAFDFQKKSGDRLLAEAEAKLARVVEAITRSGENGLMTEGEAKRLLALAAVKEPASRELQRLRAFGAAAREKP
jgi:hypothetical protein